MEVAGSISQSARMVGIQRNFVHLSLAIGWYRESNCSLS